MTYIVKNAGWTYLSTYEEALTFAFRNKILFLLFVFYLFSFSGTSPEGGLSTLVVVIIAIVSGICVIGLACGFYRICCRRDRLSSRKFDAGKASESTSKYNTVSQSLDI